MTDEVNNLSPIAARAAHNAFLGNVNRTDGLDRSPCGCKYWENDRCIDCGSPATIDDNDDVHCCDADEDLDYGRGYAGPVTCAGCGCEMEYLGDGTDATGNGRMWWAPVWWR